MRRTLGTTAALVVMTAAGWLPGPPTSSAQAQGARKAAPAPAAKKAAGAYQPDGAGYGPGGQEAERPKDKDSFYYYGPNGLWYRWTDDQKLGRDTWLFYTGGNYKFYRQLTKFSGALGVSMDFLRLLAASPEDRFRKIGLINEPNFEGKYEDEFGFTVDKWKGDPIPGAYPEDPKWYGEPTGVIGLRKFANPAFTAALKAEWIKDKKASVRKYFQNPSGVEPPYLLGITCALCHVAFDPLNPPDDPVHPRWEHLSANIGNQYLREGDLFFGPGRVVAGDANPGPNYPEDPYDTKGLDETSFLYQYGHTQQPGTSETSRFTYDFLNNPNTINQLFYVGNRAAFAEETPTGAEVLTPHILKDGADSVGIHAALLRVFINIGAEGDYLLDRLWNPIFGMSQRPFSLQEVRLEVPEARKAELLARYPELGQAWKETERRVPFLASYLASYTPFDLATIKDQEGNPKHITKDRAQLRRGAVVFAETCAGCHSNKQPFYPISSEAEKRAFFRSLVLSDQFLPGNTLSDDVRYPFNYPGLGVNAARAMGTNALDGDIWADFSSQDYKALPPLGFVTFENPLNQLDPAFGDSPIVTSFVARGGGRGYYRTAALNSMWATAPFLHNNSMGADPVDEQGLTDPQAITVEGRLALFEKAMDELLNPGKRPIKVKVTSTDSTFTAGMAGAERRLASVLASVARNAVEETFTEVVAETIATSDAPPELKPALRIVLGELVVRLRPEIEKVYTRENLEAVKGQIARAIQAQVEALIAEKLKETPRLAQLLTPLRGQFEEALKKRSENLADLFRSRFVIPKGTPINLILNLDEGKFPYALQLYLTSADNPRKVAEELLKRSECPDLIENRGHTYGSDLDPQDKRALIEFLKTL